MKNFLKFIALAGVISIFSIGCGGVDNTVTKQKDMTGKQPSKVVNDSDVDNETAAGGEASAATPPDAP